MTNNLLYKRNIPVNDDISIYVPDVGEVIDNEDEYYSLVTMCTAMPIDLLVLLDDLHKDFTKVTEFELFLLLFPTIQSSDTKLIFGDLDLSNFDVYTNKENGNLVLYDPNQDIVIDKEIHAKIASILRSVHHLEKNIRKPGNEEAKKYLIRRAREKMRRNRNRKQSSELESLIIAMVCTEQFKYDFDSVRKLSIYQFNESVRQIINKVDYDNLMYGIYAGTVNAKELSQDRLNWLTHK